MEIKIPSLFVFSIFLAFATLEPRKNRMIIYRTMFTDDQTIHLRCVWDSYRLWQRAMYLCQVKQVNVRNLNRKGRPYKHNPALLWLLSTQETGKDICVYTQCDRRFNSICHLPCNGGGSDEAQSSRPERKFVKCVRKRNFCDLRQNLTALSGYTTYDATTQTSPATGNPQKTEVGFHSSLLMSKAAKAGSRDKPTRQKVMTHRGVTSQHNSLGPKREESN